MTQNLIVEGQLFSMLLIMAVEEPFYTLQLMVADSKMEVLHINMQPKMATQDFIPKIILLLRAVSTMDLGLRT